MHARNSGFCFRRSLLDILDSRRERTYATHLHSREKKCALRNLIYKHGSSRVYSSKDASNARGQYAMTVPAAARLADD